jgi:hypothetical protein
MAGKRVFYIPAKNIWPDWPDEYLKILNLRNPKDDPIFWSEIEEIENYLIYIPFIQTLQKELSLPIRKRDKALDYIPTQYIFISEFIKSIKKKDELFFYGV